jgi:hypothetical protein
MHTKTWPSQAILVSDWLSSKKHSSLKQLCQMKPPQTILQLAKRFQRRRFFLDFDQSETRIACGGHVC